MITEFPVPMLPPSPGSEPATLLPGLLWPVHGVWAPEWGTVALRKTGGAAPQVGLDRSHLVFEFNVLKPKRLFVSEVGRAQGATGGCSDVQLVSELAKPCQVPVL